MIPRLYFVELWNSTLLQDKYFLQVLDPFRTGFSVLISRNMLLPIKECFFAECNLDIGLHLRTESQFGAAVGSGGPGAVWLLRWRIACDRHRLPTPHRIGVPG
jgi:hypothetical protein